MIRATFLSTLAILAFSQATKPTSSSPTLLMVQGHGFTFEYSQAHFIPGCQPKQEPRLTMEENGTDMPFDIGPIRIKFPLQLKTPGFVQDKKGWAERESWIQIVPLQDSSVPDFNKAYPELYSCANDLRAMLKSGKTPAAVNKDLPDWNSGDCIQTVHAKAGIAETSWCTGIQYLTTHVQESCEIDNDRLVFRFVGLSKDGKFFINVSIPVAHPTLPISAPGIDSAPKSTVDSYCKSAEGILNRQDNRSFFPTITSLSDLIQSLRPKP